MVAQLPGFDFTAEVAFIPAVNVILLMKQVLIDGFIAESFFLVAVSTLAYTALTLAVASLLFAQESVVVGDKGQFRLLASRSSMIARPVPGMAEGFAWYGILFVLLFYVGTGVQSWHALGGLAITLWGLLLLPTVGVAWYLKVDFKETFALYKPSARTMGAAVIWGLTAWILIAHFAQLTSQWFPPPEELAEQMTDVLTAETPAQIVLLFFLVSISPAICEEAMFRGFLFSSLRDRVAPWAVVVITAVLFGAFHLSLYRLIPTTLLGILMGILVLRSRSIWTSAVFHGLNNGAAIVLLAAAPASAQTDTMPMWTLPIGAVGLVVGALLLRSDHSSPPSSSSSS